MLNELDRTVKYLEELNNYDEKQRLLAAYCLNENDIQKLKEDINRI